MFAPINEIVWHSYIQAAPCDFNDLCTQMCTAMFASEKLFLANSLLSHSFQLYNKPEQLTQQHLKQHIIYTIDINFILIFLILFIIIIPLYSICTVFFITSLLKNNSFTIIHTVNYYITYRIISILHAV